MRVYYDFYNSELPDNVCCPVLLAFILTPSTTIAKFLHDDIAYRAGEMMGFGSDYGTMLTPSNAISLQRGLSEMFDEGRWTLVGYLEGNQREYTFEVLDDEIFDHSITHSASDQTHKVTRIADLNHSKLRFKNNQRPEAKFVFWHFAMSCIRQFNRNPAGMSRKIKELKFRWTLATWYEGVMLKLVARYWGEIARLIFQGTTKPELEAILSEQTMRTAALIWLKETKRAALQDEVKQEEQDAQTQD